MEPPFVEKGGFFAQQVWRAQDAESVTRAKHPECVDREANVQPLWEAAFDGSTGSRGSFACAF
jgi:hypothetical protein